MKKPKKQNAEPSRSILDRWAAVLGADQLRQRIAVLLGLHVVTLYRRIDDGNWTTAELLVLELIERMSPAERAAWWKGRMV